MCVCLGGGGIARQNENEHINSNGCPEKTSQRMTVESRHKTEADFRDFPTHINP